MLKGITFERNYQTGRMTVNLEKTFEEVFRTHFKCLHAYASTLLRDPGTAEEIVQNMFVRLWEKKEEIDIKEKISSYLYRAVHNDCLNYLKHLKVRSAYQSHVMRQQIPNDKEKTSEKVSVRELETRLEQALNQLPEQCRTIFQLSRFEELKYKEIADKLGLSIKTVETQMGKALRLMRLQLLDYLTILVVIFCHLIKSTL